MHEFQKNYLNFKNLYDHYLKTEQYDKLEEVEDDYLEAESLLVNWVIDEAVKAGMSKEDAEYLKKNWIHNTEKIIDLALRLKVA